MSPTRSTALQGKVALVTGACTGIGKVIATHYGLAGASVAVNHRHTPDRADTVVAELRGQGITAMAADADVSVRDQLESVVDQVLGAFGRWDILVSNAAVAITQPLVDGGRIINLGSSTTGLMLPGYAVYDASKAGVEQLTRIGSHELGYRNISVNVLAPGATATPTYAAGRGEELVARFSAMSAYGRLGTPDEIAQVATFLASDEAGWITSQVIRVNGGTV